MSQPPGSYSSRYGGPNNIVIVPTVSFSKNSLVKTSPSSSTTNLDKIDERTRPDSKEYVSSVEMKCPNTQGQPNPLIEHQSKKYLVELKQTDSMDQIEPKPMVENLNPIISLAHKPHSNPGVSTSNEHVKNLAIAEDMNITKKVNSWASNYLQSIGHNNTKPIKMNLSSTRKKMERTETVATNNDLNTTFAQQKLYKDTKTSSCEVFNMTESFRESNKLDNKITGENIFIGNLKPLHAPKKSNDGLRRPSLHTIKETPVLSMSDNTLTPINSPVLVDTIYSNDNNSKAPAYATLLAKSNGEATYTYKDGHCKKNDILDAIKSKINRKTAIELKSCAMNLPTHKDMCEDFIKEISINKSSVTERKGDRSKSSPPAKSKETYLTKNKSSTPKPNSKVNKSKPKESSSTLKIMNKEQFIKSNLPPTKKVDERKNYQDYQRYKKPQNIKPITDLKKSDNLNKPNVDKKTDRQPKMAINSPKRPNLKRARTCSVDRGNSGSESTTISPIKSIVQIADDYQSNSPKRKCFDEHFDLRSKLSRVNQRIDRKRKENDLNKKSKQRENLKITVENQNDENYKSPKKSSVLKYKTNKCKKLKLIINVICQGSDDESTSSESCSSEAENNPTHNMDLSFLDDFNVDEIVDSLRNSPKQKTKSPLPHESKTGNSTKISAEPELKLATLLNMLNAKSGTNNNIINSVKTECKFEETKRSNRVKLPTMNILNPVSVMSSINKKEETEADEISLTDNITHNLVKTLCQTKFQLHQQKTETSDVKYLDAKSSIQTEEYFDVNMRKVNEQHSEDNEGLLKDKSVIIYEQEISIIDLTDENQSAAIEIHNITAAATPNNIQQNKLSIGNKTEGIITELNQHQSVEVNDSKIVNQLKTTPNTRLTKHTHYPKENNKVATTAFKIESTVINQYHDSIIDLTDDVTDDVGIYKNMGEIGVSADKESKIIIEDLNENSRFTISAKTAEQNTMTQMNVEKEIIENQNVHLISPSKNDNLLKEIEKPVETKIQTIENKNRTNLNTTIHFETNKPMAIVKYVNPINIGLIISDDQTKCDTATVLKLDNQDAINMEENLNKIVENVPDTSDTPSKRNASSDIKKQCKMFGAGTANKLLENVVKIEWDNDELENKFKNSDTEIEIRNLPQGKDTRTKTEIERTDTNIERSTSNNITKELVTTNPDTVEVIEPVIQNIKNKECVKNVSDTTSNTPSKDNDLSDNKKINKIFESKTAKEVLEKIVESVWDTKNELENTSKTNNTENEIENPNQANGTNETDTKMEIGNAKTNQNKVKKNCNTDGKFKAVVPLLEEKMLELNKNIKIIKHINRGKYSNIFSCSDTKGQIYAAKVIICENSRHNLGIEKEQMIRQLQKNIPRENLNTVFLVDSFRLGRYWCFLTEYYPKNLLQVLQEQRKPFHINRVQNLMSQLMAAVMNLKNSGIVHSDIKPSHILLNSSYDRLKLCGFDSAYYGNTDLLLLPNAGTIHYRAPEIILGFPAGYSMDVWSSALVIYEMATNVILFPAIYNNDVLYKQMCTFGNLPRDIVETSIYKNQHFQGRIFMRRVGHRGRDAVLFTNFYKSSRLQRTLWLAFNRQVNDRNADMKLKALTLLLEQMLLLDPRQRLAVEFVCADPFIYNMW